MIRPIFSVITMLSIAFTACSQTQTATVLPIVAQTEAGVAPVVVFPLPERFVFAGEEVPLDNFDTRESLSREIQTNAYLHSRTLQIIQATKRYFPIIEPVLEKYGVPADFKYLCVAESELNPNAVSSAGAVGLWQLMKATGTAGGLFVDAGLVDERYNIEKATEVACKYLLEAKNKFGSWTEAAASYNLGQAGLKRRMDLQPGTDGYYDLYLPNETARYVFRILAFKLIIESPQSYGYILSDGDYQKPHTAFKEVDVKGATIDWAAEAVKHGTNYKMLRELNPWVRDYKYANKGSRVFKLKVPEDGFRK